MVDTVKRGFDGILKCDDVDVVFVYIVQRRIQSGGLPAADKKGLGSNLD